MSQGGNGRDHHNKSMTVWIAGAGIRLAEQAVVEPEFAGQRVGGADPVNRALDRAPVLGLAAAAVGVQRAAQGDDLAAQAVAVGSIRVLAAVMEGADVPALRETLDKLKDKLGARRFEFNEGGDKAYVVLSKAAEPEQIAAALTEAGVKNNKVQRFGRAEENRYEVVLVSLDSEVRAALDKKLGAGSVKEIPSVSSVGAKAGKELRDSGIISLLAAIGFIMLYILVRFDFRYGPGTVIALLHDAILVMGAFAITYKEFSLTTIAAILTVIGYSMNDTIVVFDRIRENASKLRDKKFPQIVNISVNETLSRTILTSLTVFFVTLAMNIWGTGVIRDFGFAMNVGVIVGTYSSIFVASPVLIWLNERAQAATPSSKR